MTNGVRSFRSHPGFFARTVCCVGFFASACERPPGSLARPDTGVQDAGLDQDEPDEATPTPPIPAPGARRLLAGPARLVGGSTTSAVSADGRWLAVSLGGGGHHSLYLLDLDGGPPRLIASSLEADPAETAWDGDVLVIGSTNRSRSGIAFVGDRLLFRPGWAQTQRAVASVGLTCDVAPNGAAVACVTRQDPEAQTYDLAFGPVDGSSETRIALGRQYYDDLGSYSFQWTPDGRFYVVSGRSDAASPERITVHTATTGETAATIGEGSQPRVSPDGLTVAFLAGDVLTLAPIDGGSHRGLRNGVASAVWLDPKTLATLERPATSYDLHRVGLDGGSALLASGIDGVAAINRTPNRIAFVAGGRLRAIDDTGQSLCERSYEPPLAAQVTRFIDGGRQLAYADGAEVFLGVGAGHLVTLEGCAVRPLPRLLRDVVWMSSGLLASSTANGLTATLHWLGSAAAEPDVLQERATLPFGVSVPRGLLVFALDEGPDAGVYTLRVGE